MLYRYHFYSSDTGTVFKLRWMGALVLIMSTYIPPGLHWRMCSMRSSWWMWWTVRIVSTCPCWDVLSSASPSPRSTVGLLSSTANVSSWMLTHLWAHWPCSDTRHFYVIVSDFSGSTGFCDYYWKWVPPVLLSMLGHSLLLLLHIKKIPLAKHEVALSHGKCNLFVTKENTSSQQDIDMMGTFCRCFSLRDHREAR